MFISSIKRFFALAPLQCGDLIELEVSIVLIKGYFLVLRTESAKSSSSYRGTRLQDATVSINIYPRRAG
jgi:hypothetical protein